MPISRHGRRALCVLLLLLFAVSTMLGVGWYFLNARHLALLVSERLSATLGMQVTVASVRLGTHETTLSDVAVHEVGTEEPSWIVVPQVETDLSLSDLLHGDTTPQTVTLHHATITLRFTADGQLLTRLPAKTGRSGQIPTLRLVDGTLILCQEGRPDFVAHGIEVCLQPDDQGLVMNGTTSDPYWGDWSTHAEFALEPPAWLLTFATRNPIHLTQDKLSRVPFVPTSVWQQLELDANTPVELTLRKDSEALLPSYRVVVQPERARLQLLPLDLTVTDASGQVVIEDNRIEVTQGQGTTADGRVDLNGTLDFRVAPPQLALSVQTQRLSLQRLPRSWMLPEQLAGRFTGNARLDIGLDPTGPRTSGQGEGEITEAQLAGLPARPIRLKLQADGLRPRTARGIEETESATSNILDASFGLEDADLQELLQRLGLPLPPEIQGRISFTAQAQIPLDRAADFDRWTMQGNVALSQVQTWGIALQDARSKFDLRKGSLRLDDFAARWPAGGTLQGRLICGLFPPRDVQGTVQLRQVALTAFRPLAPEALDSLAGRLHGEIEAQAPLEHLANLRSWKGRAALTTEGMQVRGITVDVLQAQARVQEGQLRIEDLQGRHGATRLTGQGLLALAAPYAFDGTVRTHDVDLAELRALTKASFPLTGRLSAAASASGTLTPLHWSAKGTADGAELKVHDLDLDSIHTEWSADPTQFRFTDLQAQLEGGTITGDANLPIAPEAVGTFRTTFQNFSLYRLRRYLPASIPTLRGILAGKAHGQLVPTDPTTLQAEASLEVPRLRHQEVVADSCRATLAWHNRTLDYHVGAQLCGGRVETRGAWTEQAGPKGRLVVAGLRLHQLWTGLNLQGLLTSLHGSAHLQMAYGRDDPAGLVESQGEFQLVRLRWQDVEIPGVIRGQMQYADGRLRIPDLNGSIGQGQVMGRITVHPGANPRGWCNLQIEGVQAAHLLAPWPELAQHINGTATVRLRGGLNREGQGNAELTLSHGQVFGLDVSEWQVPLSWTYHPESGQGQLDIRESHAQLARGRVQGRLSYAWGPGSRLDGQVHFFGLDLREFRQEAPELKLTGAGKLSGRIDFNGANVASVDDVTARIDASFAQSQAMTLPVLQQLAPYLAPGLALSAVFPRGELQGVLNRGVLRIVRFHLDGPILQMFITGNVTMQGRLHLHVWANTGRFGLDTATLRALLLRIPVLGPIPLAVITEANQYLSSLLLHLRVTGTVHSPTVRLEPFTLLTEEGIRFFVMRLAPAR